MSAAARVAPVLAIAVAASFFALHSAYQLNHNDFMYAASAVAPGGLYEDVHLVQAPLTFFAWKAVALAAPAGETFATLRTASLLLVLGCLALGAVAVARTPASRVLLAASFAASPYLHTVASEIGNYSLALILTTVAGCLLARGDRTTARTVLAGVLVGAAVSVKVNQVAFLIPLWLWAGPPRARVAALAGAAVGMLPLVVELVQSPHAFLLHNLYFHSDLTASMRGWSPRAFAGNALYGLLAFSLVHGSAIAVAAFAAVRGPLRRSLLLWLSMLGAGLVAALLPGTVFTQYLAPLALYGSFAVAVAFDDAGRAGRRAIALLVAPFLAWSLVHEVQRLERQVGRVEGRPPILEVRDIQRSLRALRDRVDAACSDRLFTFAGALAVDSGFSPAKYTEAGVFWARLRGHVPARYTNDPRYRLDPELVDPVPWVRREGIAFVLVGYYPRREPERELRAYAVERGFARTVVGRFGTHEIELWSDPACLVVTPTKNGTADPPPS